ncbi:MAG TPA: proline--tRNA ligase [Acidimicrobiales bacterium]|nr:proline--tRNA ligase [Acidimicrobiales bacterium]
MRMSKLLLRTLRDAPADADVEGHALLVRGGYVRRLVSGVYTFLPLGWRALHKIESIVRQELDGVGMQEMLMPALSPYELWEESGRSAFFGQDALPAMTLQARGGRFVLGPTHEEVCTHTVGAEIESYRQLPLTVYQVQTKFRDEARPRYGLLRTRELVMCDAYSFDADKPAMSASYQAAVAAYLRIFGRLSLEVVPVVAQSGAIGGDVNHEFMVPSVVGEDHFVRCSTCDYAANVEAAETRPPDAGTPAPGAPPGSPVAHETPGCPGIAGVVAFLAEEGESFEAADFLKCVAVLDADATPTIILVPGDREARLPHGWRLFEEADFAAHPELIRGYIGPMGRRGTGVRVVADVSVGGRPGPWVTGSNRVDAHVSGVWLERDFTVDEWGSFVGAGEGDRCPSCDGTLSLVRSVEAAHTFQLGLKYSSVMTGGTFLNEEGTEVPMWMGCYGMGMSRLLAIVAEEHHDEAGLLWPLAVSPYAVHLVALGAGRSPAVAEATEALYAALSTLGVEVLYDDRDVSPGVKFADADLLGFPYRVLVGGKGVARGVAEVRQRAEGSDRELPLAEAAALLATEISAQLL